MPSNAPGSTPLEPKLLPKGWPRDLLILALLTGSLWAITIAWILSGSGQSLEPPIRSEKDAWIFALSGAAFIYLLVAGVVASWGAVLGIPTSLFLVSLCLRRARTQVRVFAAVLVTAAIFIGIPMVLNALEERRLTTVYEARDSAFPSSIGRAIELPSETPSIGNFPIRCDGQCLDLLTFGGADSVTRTFPKGESPAGGEAVVQNFRIGLSNRACAGASFKNFCARATDEALPLDRLVLTLETVVPQPEDAADVYARRLSVRDTARAGMATVMQTRFSFSRYSVPLNIAWGQGGFYPRRNGRPVLLTPRLDAHLYRAFLSNRTFEGKYYPFR